MDTFRQLEDLDENGFVIQSVHHDMDLKCTCDWKAATCIKGLVSASGKYFCQFCLCSKDEISEIGSKFKRIFSTCIAIE